MEHMYNIRARTEEISGWTEILVRWIYGDGEWGSFQALLSQEERFKGPERLRMDPVFVP